MKKTILITGASSGFGEACARKFRGTENRLTLAARRREKLEKLQEELFDTESFVMQLDVRDRNSVAEKLAGLPELVNINHLEVMPVCQAWGPFSIDRREE